MTTNTDDYQTAVHSNSLIMKEVVQYLDKRTLACFSQASRQSWQYALQPLWRILQFASVRQIEMFGDVVGNSIMIKTRGYTTYGDLVQTVGLALLNGRWEKVKSSHLKIIIDHCHQLRNLDINLCLAIYPDSIAEIFRATPATAASLTSLNLTEVLIDDVSLVDILKTTPNLKSLEIGETDITNRSLEHIGETMHNLEYIEMRDCVDIDDRGVAALISGCKSLKYIGVNNCPYVVDFEAIDKINERGEWEDVDEYVSDDMSGEFSDEYSEGLYDEYSDEFYEDYHGGVNGGYHGEFYDSDFEDDYDNGIF